MTGLQRVTGRPIAWVRTFIEIIIVSTGWILGGTVGLGTLLFAFGIGSAISISLSIIESVSKNT